MVDTYEVQIRQNPETGIIEHEGWRLNDKLHRVGFPALIQRDPVTGVAYKETWYRNNTRHRDDGPAVIHRDRLTGRTTEERYFVNGEEMQWVAAYVDPPDAAPEP